MNKKKNSHFFYVIFLALQLGFIISIPLILFLLIGLFLDKKFNTNPIFTVLCVIFSLFFVFFEIRYYVFPFLKKL